MTPAPQPPRSLAAQPSASSSPPRRAPPSGTSSRKYAPGIGALRSYHRPWLRPDVFAGVAVAAYLVPQVMAYASIVNVPPVAGLWTALATLIVYALVGGSRVLSCGPESTVALMAGAAVAPLAAGDPNRAMVLAAALSLVVAGWCLIARILRLGVAADLLSTPLLVGYLAGGAVLMVVGQLGRLTGTTVEGESIVEQLKSFMKVVPGTDLLTLVVGIGTLAVLLLVVMLAAPLARAAHRRRHGDDRVRGLQSRRSRRPGRRGGPDGTPGAPHPGRDDERGRHDGPRRPRCRDRRLRRQHPHRPRLPRSG